MALDPASRSRYNLEDATVLLLDDTSMGMAILVQIVTGLGAKNLHRCSDVEAAKKVAERHELDLAIVDGMAPSGMGYDFVRWMRTNCQEPNCYTPVIITTAHTPVTDVARARDCGGHIIVKKPFSPIAMLERIIWVAREGRPFLFSADYVGPDRRFRDVGPPKGGGRRREDLNADTGSANAPAQDAELQPRLAS
ncbi:response regulator [Phenylobacterium sp.]|jgi:DNA-binding response OmpR family regulator|uniref:response regulator n=1 Tax=Phenylobacterium sp. TaxID=1871053 RepID=UPI002F93391B